MHTRTPVIVFSLQRAKSDVLLHQETQDRLKVTLCSRAELWIFKISHPETSGIARSLVLAGHLLYASPLASRSCVLHTRSCDLSGTNMVL